MGGKSCRVTLPVLMVVAAISYIYFTSIFVFIDRWFGLWSSPGLINAVVFTAIAALCIFNYVVAVFTDPGRVPASFVPDIEDSDIQEIKRKSGDLRYCQKCSHYKPPRAHHCRVCKRCVLRMDHHCIWINNCVGHANYKIFFVFVLYAVIACLYSVVLLLGSIIIDTGKEEPQKEGSSRTIYVISCVLMFPLTIALGVLLVWHIYLTLQNKSTIEYYEGVKAMWLAEKGGEVYRHPYDLGAFENLTLDRSSRTLIGAGEQREGLYYLNETAPARIYHTNGVSSFDIWHRRMGHPSSKVVELLPDVSNDRNKANLDSCEIFFRAK